MTEIESQLLESVKAFQQQQEQQQTALSSSYKALQHMFTTTSAENQALKTQVKSLAEQVNGLESQLSRLMTLLTR